MADNSDKKSADRQKALDTALAAVERAFSKPRPNPLIKTDTSKRAKANRANAKKSTGPKTEEGKAIVKTNALKHGLRSEHVWTHYDQEEDFDRFKDSIHANLKPDDDCEKALVDRVVACMWRLKRVVPVEAIMLQDAPVSQYGLRFAAGNLLLLSRYETGLERSLHRALEMFYATQARRKQEESILTLPTPENTLLPNKAIEPKLDSSA